MFQIRTATTEDQESIQQIYISLVGLQANQNTACWEQLIRSGGLLVAQAGGVIVGFGGIDPAGGGTTEVADEK